MVHEARKSVLKILKPTENYYSAVLTGRKLGKVTKPLNFVVLKCQHLKIWWSCKINLNLFASHPFQK